MNISHVNIGIYIGRFEPFHKGHHMVVNNALSYCDTLIIFVGSHSNIRTKKNPFIALERITMIKKCFNNEELSKIKFHTLIDYGDMENWTNDILMCLNNFYTEGQTVGIFGCLKDSSSYYLNYFPSSFKKLFFEEPFEKINATDIRKKYFEENIIDETNLHSGVVEYLKNYQYNYIYQNLDT